MFVSLTPEHCRVQINSPGKAADKVGNAFDEQAQVGSQGVSNVVCAFKGAGTAVSEGRIEPQVKLEVPDSPPPPQADAEGLIQVEGKASVHGCIGYAPDRLAEFFGGVAEYPEDREAGIAAESAALIEGQVHAGFSEHVENRAPSAVGLNHSECAGESGANAFAGIEKYIGAVVEK